MSRLRPTRAIRNIALVLIVCTATPLAAQDPERLAGAGPGVRAAEEALAAAVHARDRSRLEQLLAPDYVFRGAPDIDRPTWIRNAVTLCWGDRWDMEGFRARSQGDVTVASFELTFYIDPATCRPAVLRSLITDVWVRQPRGWLLLVRHSGPAPPADADFASQYGVVPLRPPSLAVSSEVSLQATTGNTSTRTTGLGASLTHRADSTSTRLSTAFATSEADDVTHARSVTIQARHGMRVGRQPEIFASGSYTRDRFAGILNRVTAEGGVAYDMRLPRPHTLTTEAGLGFTSEQRIAVDDLRFATASGAVRYTGRLIPSTQLTGEVAIIADLGTAANWRTTSTTALTVALTKLLSLKASHLLEYRNMPVPGFRQLDTRTTAALVLSFERRPQSP
jgi:putative salt-induced outer membrane protein YdiY